jgi:hypothetical protein
VREETGNGAKQSTKTINVQTLAKPLRELLYQGCPNEKRLQAKTETSLQTIHQTYLHTACWRSIPQ